MLFDADLDDQPNPALTRGDCVGCHAQNPNGSNIVTGIPQVRHGGDDLAAGNFNYVVGGTPADDAKGHNVDNITTLDGILDSTPPGYLSGYDPSSVGYSSLSRLQCAGSNGCHGNRDQSNQFTAISGAHHGDDSCLKFGSIDEDLQRASVATSYRFLYKVKGGEDSDWQNASTSKHNEYKGAVLATRTGLSWSDVDTISELCGECHGNYHYSNTDTGIGTGTPWLRHPTDYSLPSTGEYTSYTTYSVVAPVARVTITGSISGTVDPTGTDDDILMCLSCHGAHATDYYKLMRWDYKSATLATALAGCIVCHTSKD